METKEFIKACHAGDLETAERLLPLADINGSNDHGQGALLTFDSDLTRFLLSHGADPNSQFNENGSSVLAGLCYVRKLDCVGQLLSAGADPDKGRDESGETPLHHVFAEDMDIVTALLESGADPNLKAKVGVISFNYGGDVRVRGETALHRACAYGSVDVIEKLLEHGGDLSIRDANGDSALSWALLHRREKPIIKLFTQ